MKLTYLIISLLFIGSFCNSALAQDNQNTQQKDGVGVLVKSDTDPVLNDPKRSAEEIELMRTAGQDNPSKITEGLTDPKMKASDIPDEASYGPSNANAEPIVEREEVIAGKTSGANTSASTNTQPIAENLNAKPIILRKTSNDQPQGKQTDKKIIYQRNTGTNTQPEGNKPSGN